MRTKIINNLDELSNFADYFISNLRPSERGATVIGLQGDLGSGKTAFVQSIAKIFGVAEYVTSPTFVIQKRYKINNSNHNEFKNLIHIDAYRLDSGEELLNLGWREILSNPKNIIFIEWSERVAEILPSGSKKIYFKFIDDKTREINYAQKTP